MVHSNKYSMNKISIALEFLWSIIFYIIFALVMKIGVRSILIEDIIFRSLIALIIYYEGFVQIDYHMTKCAEKQSKLVDECCPNRRSRENLLTVLQMVLLFVFLFMGVIVGFMGVTSIDSSLPRYVGVCFFICNFVVAAIEFVLLNGYIIKKLDT